MNEDYIAQPIPLGSTAAMNSLGKTFSLNLTNDSIQSGSFCIYLEMPLTDSSTDNQCYPLAWFVLGCHPGNYAKFKWKVDYSLHWSQQGNLDSGVIFETGGIVKADVNRGERYNFTYEDPAYKFDGKAANGGKGTIGVNADETVVNGDCMVALALANKPIAAVPIQPNSFVTFTPIPDFYLTFGTFTEGEVIDIDSQVNPIKLDFDGKGVHTLNYSLNAYNEWVPK